MPRKTLTKRARFQLYAVTAPDGRHRRMIAAESQREAAYRMGVSEHRLRHYGIDIGNADTRMMAHSSPGTVFESPCNADSWKAVLVQPYIRKHVAYAEPLRVTGEPPTPLSDRLKEFARSMQLPRNNRITTLIPETAITVRGKPMVDLLDTVMESTAGLLPRDVRAVLQVLDEIGAGVIVPGRVEPSGDVIARSKRILALVDTYTEMPNALNRTVLRHALHDEFSSLLQLVSKKD